MGRSLRTTEGELQVGTGALLAIAATMSSRSDRYFIISN